MAQKKTNSKKPLIILCVVVIVAVLAFLIYDEVQSNSYLNQLNEAISSTASLESGSAVGHSYLYAEGADRESGSSETRHAIYLRGDDGITFQESAGNEDGSELSSNFYIRPGEYFYLDTANNQWIRTDLQEGLNVRPYSLSAATSSVSSSQIRRIHKTTVDGKDAFEVIYNRQWLMSSYQGQSTDEPLTGSVIYILATDGDTTYVEETRQTLNVRVTDSDGNTSTQISEDINQLINGTTEDGGDVQQALDDFFAQNIEGNYIESTDLETETDTATESGEETTIGSSGEETTVGSSDENSAE